MGIEEEANQDLPAELVPGDAIDELLRDFGPEHEISLITDDPGEDRWACRCGLTFKSSEDAEEHSRSAESSS